MPNKQKTPASEYGMTGAKCRSANLPRLVCEAVGLVCRGTDHDGRRVALEVGVVHAVGALACSHLRQRLSRPTRPAVDKGVALGTVAADSDRERRTAAVVVTTRGHRACLHAWH